MTVLIILDRLESTRIWYVLAHTHFSNKNGGFCVVMAQPSSHSSEKRGNKKPSWASVLAEAEGILSSQKQKKKAKAKTPVYWIWKNPVTGQRTTHSKYRPRRSRKTPRVEPESGECFF